MNTLDGIGAIRVVDNRNLPMLMNPDLAFQKDLGYSELGFLNWLMALDHKGKLNDVYKVHRGNSSEFDANINYLIARQYVKEVKGGLELL